jgi:predicted Zn-dependent peptidase
MTTNDSIAVQTTPSDPFQVQEYTLRNGLKLLMSVQPYEPRIFTNIVVRAGSKQDPADTTGLAHYMEHMLFKGTSQIGALDWEKEYPLLEKIADLYELHRQAEHQEERARIYAEIDAVSGEAAKLVAANEYDKLASAIGASNTNAYTWLDQTVYVNEIPCNELERWMMLEAERFRMMALRLFHTELETVYEEFNISQDRDFRKAGNALRAALYPNHPYGTQTTLGSPEHLKKPSIRNIQAFFNTYYVPNNMAIILAGDFDPDQAIILAEKYFNHYASKPIPPFISLTPPPITQPVRTEVFGMEAPYLQIGWRFGPAKADTHVILNLLRRILHNQQAGLLDVNLNQQQRVLDAEAWSWIHTDLSAFGLYAQPREGQSLEEAENLLLEQIGLLREGHFDDALLEAAVKATTLEEWKALESNSQRVARMTFAFINDIPWPQLLARKQVLKSITKAQICSFAQQHLREDNFAVVYKRQGQDTNIIKVDKPPISPVSLNRDDQSGFARQFLQIPASPIQPLFPDFRASIHHIPLNPGLSLHFVRNPANPLFRIDFIFETGKNSDTSLPIALNYLLYLGTPTNSAAQLKLELYRLGLSLDTACYEDRAYISLSGLEESLHDGLRLLADLLHSARPDDTVLRNIISDTLLNRQHARNDKNTILRDAMGAYARFGPHSPFTAKISEAALKSLQPEQLIQGIQQLAAYEHQIYYYGQQNPEVIIRLLEQHNLLPDQLQPVPPPPLFPELDTPEHKVLLVDFPMVQTDVMLVSKGTPTFSPEELLYRDWYNEYFGYGLSSIVFQEIREARALAYATYALYSTPVKKDKAQYLRAYVGTQPDKLHTAIPAMMNIIDDMPVSHTQMEQARLSIIKKLSSERIHPAKYYWSARTGRDLGFEHDFRQDVYHHLLQAGNQHLIDFQQQYVKNRAYTLLVLGHQQHIDIPLLEKIGPITTLSLDDIFAH